MKATATEIDFINDDLKAIAVDVALGEEEIRLEFEILPLEIEIDSNFCIIDKFKNDLLDCNPKAKRSLCKLVAHFYKNKVVDLPVDLGSLRSIEDAREDFNRLRHQAGRKP
ncbi:MAG: hypothetical protein MUF49_02480 [Oculatellaceae cyanobacterium Prado106]|jgi:hypothetical protein|nr:hypothetical protein [Oculatellaceae cyanobacterium Prado106]